LENTSVRAYGELVVDERASTRVRLTADEGIGVDERPVTRYVKAPDGVSIAYQVIGDGPSDVLLPSALAIPIDLFWDEPSFVRFANRLAGFSRVVMLDPRGVGASGGDFQDNSVEEVTDSDTWSVLDAIGCEREVVFAVGPIGPFAVRSAANHPDRTKALILVNSFARCVAGDDYPCGLPPEALEQLVADMVQTYGTGAQVDVIAPSRSGDEAFRTWLARSQRLGMGVDQAEAMLRALFLQQDVRALLPTLAVPTLVLHRVGTRLIPVGVGRYLAEQIPGAKYVELPGDDHLPFVGDTDALLDEVEEFLTGSRQAPEGDVVTATILFTDMVASTEQSARMGHRKWTALTDQHDTMIRATLARYRGHEVKSIGDGFLATFDATTRAVRAAVEIVTQAKNMGIEVRAGVHLGEVEIRPDDVVGLTVSITKRICDLAGPAEVFVSEAVKALLVGSGIATSEHGTYVLKGVPDEWRLYAIEG
jgi:class 3 adenylate cyclase